jgi:hypothetical protein
MAESYAKKEVKQDFKQLVSTIGVERAVKLAGYMDSNGIGSELLDEVLVENFGNHPLVASTYTRLTATVRDLRVSESFAESKDVTSKPLATALLLEGLKEFSINHDAVTLNDLSNNLTKELLETLARSLGSSLTIEDVDWQVVYDLKEHILKALRALGVTVPNF